MTKPNRNAFTLIELLVVIAIVALLLAIMLPALGRSRHAGQEVRCQSNVRQIATAMRCYMDTYKRFPAQLRFGEERGGLGLAPESLACPLNHTEPAGWTMETTGLNAFWTWSQLTSYESVLLTQGNLGWNPIAYINRWEQARPDKQPPMVNDARPSPYSTAIGWHGKDTYNAAWGGGARCEVGVWNGVLN